VTKPNEASKATERPWKSNKKGHTVRICDKSGGEIAVMIEFMCGKPEVFDKDGFANARLIVTAVNAHERLRKIVERVWVENQCHECDDSMVCESCLYEEARALLAELDEIAWEEGG